MAKLRGFNGAVDEDTRVGETLRTLREARGLKVGELARHLEISSQYWSNIEAGRRRLTPRLLVAVAKALSVRQAAILCADYFDGDDDSEDLDGQ